METDIIMKKFGFYISLSLTLLTIFTFTIAMLTPPLSGPFCPGNCYEYPFHNIADRYPRDYYWMFPAMALTLLYVVFTICIYSASPNNRKIFGRIAVAFSILSASFLLVCYFIQVTVIQPSLLNGETEGIALWSQYNPHGLFIALEELGYILMVISFLFLAFTNNAANKTEKILTWTYLIGFAFALITLIMISLKFGIRREYRYEVVIISIDWLVLIMAGIFQSIAFKKL